MSGVFNVTLTLILLIAWLTFLIMLISIPPFMRLFTFASFLNGDCVSGCQEGVLDIDYIIIYFRKVKM